MRDTPEANDPYIFGLVNFTAGGALITSALLEVQSPIFLGATLMLIGVALLCNSAIWRVRT